MEDKKYDPKSFKSERNDNGFLYQASKYIYKTLDFFTRHIQHASLEQVAKYSAMPDNPFCETDDLPFKYKWSAFFVYYGGFIGIFIYFLWYNYEQGITSTFISLDPTAGVCRGSSSNLCCEVPVTITGEFLADTNGLWNTQTGFNYNRACYAITATGLTYNTSQYKSVMTGIKNSLIPIGAKSANRDFAWNLIALSSFVVASENEFGSLRFYSTGDAGVIFDKVIYGINMASQAQICNLPWTSSYTQSSSELLMTFNLNISQGVDINGNTLYNCPYDYNGGECFNPCSETIGLNSFGYDVTRGSNLLQLSIGMSEVTTAMAINLGLSNISDLVEVPYDHVRQDLFANILATSASSYIGNSSTYYFSSYYDVLYAPMNPIYCITYLDINVTQCMVRFGNTFAYPVASSWGYYSSTSSSIPSQCTLRSVATSTAANYYCNLMDVLVGFIYYPNSDCDVPYTGVLPTPAPTLLPTQYPSGPTHHPHTRVPTHNPTISTLAIVSRSLSEKSEKVKNNKIKLLDNTWNELYIGSGIFSGITSSSTGIDIYACVDGGYIYSSSNGGISWSTGTSTTESYVAITSDSTGAYVYAVDTVGNIYGSANYGESYNTIFSNGNITWSDVITTTTGQYIFVIGYNSLTQYGNVYTSNNFGSSWNEVTASSGLQCITAISTGQYVFVGFSGGVYVSTDSGNTFPVLGYFSANIVDITTYGPADYLLFYAIDNTGNVYNLIDTGSINNPLSLGVSSNNFYISCDSTGQYVYVTGELISIYLSNDYGTTFSISNSNSLSWSDIIISSTNLQAFVITSTGSIYGTITPTPSPTMYPTFYYFPQTYDSPVQYYTFNYTRYYQNRREHYAANAPSSSSGSSNTNSYYSSQGSQTPNVTFQPFQTKCYDNGKIFAFTRAMALVNKNYTNYESTKDKGSILSPDTYAINLAYSAMVNTILSINTTSAWKLLCSGKQNISDYSYNKKNKKDNTKSQLIPGGCAVLAIEFYGGDDLHVSKYYYQPSSISFKNSIYLSKVMTLLIQTSPTRLIQLYYNCVLDSLTSLQTATGIAFSNTQLYLSVAFLIFVFIVLKYERYFRKKIIPSKLENAIKEEEQQQETDKLLDYLKELQELNALGRLKALEKDAITNADKFIHLSEEISNENNSKEADVEDIKEVVPLEIEISNKDDVDSYQPVKKIQDE